LIFGVSYWLSLHLIVDVSMCFLMVIPGPGTQSGEQIVLLPAFLCSLATQLLSLPVDKLKYLAARIDSKVFPFAISKI